MSTPEPPPRRKRAPYPGGPARKRTAHDIEPPSKPRRTPKPYPGGPRKRSEPSPAAAPAAVTDQTDARELTLAWSPRQIIGGFALIAALVLLLLRRRRRSDRGSGG